MTAWARLLAASSLAIGTAWDLITHPRTGGSGVVVNTGVSVLLTDKPLGITLASRPLAVTVADTRIAAVIAPGITVSITTQPLKI